MDEKKTLTYEEYLLGQKTAADNLAKMKLTEAQGQAQKQYESAISEADKRFAQYMNPYGSSQQKIADMGLSGSGYANYLNDRAYIANIAERQAASAARSEADRLAKYDYDVALAGTQADYDSKYGAWLLEQESVKKAKTEAISSELAMLSGAEKISALENLVKSGYLTPDDDLYKTSLNSAYEDLNKNYSSDKFNDLSEDAVNSYLDYLESSGKHEQKNEASKAYSDATSPKTYVNIGGNTLGVDTNEFVTASTGDKIKVRFGMDKYKVNKGAEVTDSSVVKAAKSINASGAVVFGLNGNVYIAYNGKAYAIDERNSADYNSLKSFVFEGDQIYVEQGQDGKYYDRNGKKYTWEAGIFGTTAVDEQGNKYRVKTDNGKQRLVPIK